MVCVHCTPLPVLQLLGPRWATIHAMSLLIVSFRSCHCCGAISTILYIYSIYIHIGVGWHRNWHLHMIESVPKRTHCEVSDDLGRDRTCVRFLLQLKAFSSCERGCMEY